jgi:chromosome segregation ATPase
MTAKGRWVSGIEEQARYVEEAARHKTAGEEDLEQASTLTAERDDLNARVDGLESRLGRRDAERQDVTRQLAAATENDNVDLGASLRPRAEQLTVAIDSLTGQREALRKRLEAIGTGQEHGELYEALSAAGQHTAEHQKMLNLAYPDSPAARHAAYWDEMQAIIRAQADRIREESKPKPVQQRMVVR